MARQGWGRHTVVATGSNDGTKQVSVNAWNNDLDETGMLGFDLETKTLSSDALTPVSSANIVAGEGASADDFSFIVYGSSPDIAEEDILFFYKGSQVITVTHNTSSAPSNAGNIQLIGGASKVLDTNLPLILQRKGNVFYEIVSSADSVTATSTTTFSNKSIDLTDNTLTGTSLELKTAISDETGSGALVFATSPTFVTPVLGQPASGNLADCTFPTLNQSTTGSSASCTGNSATATALATARTIGGTSFDGTGNIAITTNANLTGEVTSSGNATTIAGNIVDEANLKVSNAPTNGYMLTAQSGDTGGLTWAAAGGGGGAWSFLEAHTFNGSETSYSFLTDFNAANYSEFHIVFRGYCAAGDLEIEWDQQTSTYYGVNRNNGTQTLSSNTSKVMILDGLSASYHNHIDIYISAKEKTAGTAMGTTDTGQNVQTSAFGRVYTNNTSGILREIIISFAAAPTSTAVTYMYGLSSS